MQPVVFQRAWSDKPDKGIPPHLQLLEHTANIEVDPRTPLLLVTYGKGAFCSKFQLSRTQRASFRRVLLTTVILQEFRPSKISHFLNFILLLKISL